MPEQIDSRGTRMSVRPLTEHEQKRWPNAEIAFTIHYAEGVPAHALTMIEDAEEFARAIGLACVDARVAREQREDPEWPKERLRNRIMFVRCTCGKLYSLSVALFVCDAEKRGLFICPDCGQNQEEINEYPIPFDEGWDKGAERLLPSFVQRHGEGTRAYYTGLHGCRLDLS